MSFYELDALCLSRLCCTIGRWFSWNGFWLTSSTLLLTLGASAAVASAAVHAAEIGTTLASGVSHWHRENVDREF
jgi:uncharacterized membrane protein YfcA